MLRPFVGRKKGRRDFRKSTVASAVAAYVKAKAATARANRVKLRFRVIRRCGPSQTA
jgi:hypothetical protein